MVVLIINFTVSSSFTHLRNVKYRFAANSDIFSNAIVALMALSQFQLNRLTSLHTQVSNFEDFKQMIEHMKSLEDLTWATKDTGYYADEIFSYFCVQFSQRHLTRLTLDTNALTSRALESLSLLTGLKDFTLKNSRCGLPPLSTNLRRLNLYECHSIRGFDVSLFPYLESLTVQNPAWTVALAKITRCGNLTQLKPNIKFPMTALPIHKMTQLQDLECIMHPEISTNEQFDNLTPLIHLTKLDLINPSPASNLSSLWSLTQLKALLIKSFVTAYFPINKLCNALPNLESLTLYGWMVPQSAPNISSLRHLTALVIECPSCSAHLHGLQHLPCHKISGIDSLTNLEVLELKICGYPSLSQLTRLRSLTYRVNCHSQPATAAQFIDHVANVPKLALEKFQITGVAEKSIHDNITRLITLQTSLQELLVGTAPSPEKSRSNYHTSTLMGFKRSMQQYADELKEKEKEAAEWSDDDKFSLSL